MRLKPVYVTDPNLVDAPLTEVQNQWAPQQGIHLYHFPLSLDSQKVRQGLDELGIGWQSHPILLPGHQQFSPSYVRINSRCVVPTIVHITPVFWRYYTWIKVRVYSLTLIVKLFYPM